MTDFTEKREDLLSLTTDIVAAHVSNNAVPTDNLKALLQEVYDALAHISKQCALPEKLQPAVPIEESVQPNYIICLEDGRKLQMLKRHIRRIYNLTPEQYRQRWGLPLDYPMVAPNYSKKRSGLARDFGLGKKK